VACTAAPVAESDDAAVDLEQAGLQGQVEPVGWDGDRPGDVRAGEALSATTSGSLNRKSAYRLSITSRPPHTVRTAASATRR